MTETIIPRQKSKNINGLIEYRIEYLRQLYWAYLAATTVLCEFTLIFTFLPTELCFRMVSSGSFFMFTIIFGILTYRTRSNYERLEVELNNLKSTNDE